MLEIVNQRQFLTAGIRVRRCGVVGPTYSPQCATRVRVWPVIGAHQIFGDAEVRTNRVH